MPCRLRCCRVSTGPARSEPEYPDLLQHWYELGAVGSLLGRNDQGQRAAAAVRAQVDLAGAAPARTPQALASRTTSTSRPAGRRGSATEFRPGVPTTRPLRVDKSWSWIDAGTGRVLVRAHDGGVHRDVPVDPPAASAAAWTSCSSRSQIPSADQADAADYGGPDQNIDASLTGRYAPGSPLRALSRSHWVYSHWPPPQHGLPDEE